MSTQNPTRDEATGEALDHYGRPCPIARALGRLEADNLTEARKKNSRDLAHAIAQGSNDLIDRYETIGSALDAAMAVIGNSTDDDQVRALLEMMLEYRVESANRAFELSALVMAGLERGKLIAAPAEEVAHG